MYKHECVKCLREHGFNCIWNIGFFDRLLGNDSVKYCPEYIAIGKYQKRYNRKVIKK